MEAGEEIIEDDDVDEAPDDRGQFDIRNANRDDLRRNVVNQSSRKAYHRLLGKFICYLYQDAVLNQLITPAFEAALDDAECTEVFAREYLEGAPANPPLLFEDLREEHIMRWILSIRKGNGDEVPGIDYLSQHRSAVFHLFRLYDQARVYQRNIEQEIEIAFAAYRRLRAINTQHGEGNVQVGKTPMEFGMYEQLAKSLLSTGTTASHRFAHLFLTLCWNLMSRAGSCENIHISHMSWKQDSMQIYFAHTKNDQAGMQSRHPRHIYANPVNPSICPILSLGIYWICNPFKVKADGTVEQRLFPGRYDQTPFITYMFSYPVLTKSTQKFMLGDRQYNRFSNILNSVLARPGVRELLAERGLHASDIGTHSIRKGAATFASQGTTACPSLASISNRAGWTMGQVRDIYLRYEAAGDQYCGRVVSGLSIMSPQFALTPPYFRERQNEHEILLIRRAIEVSFVNMPDRLRRIAEFALASVVHHRNFLREVLAATHPLFSTPLFRTANLLNELGALVLCVLPNQQGADGLAVTGRIEGCMIKSFIISFIF